MLLPLPSRRAGPHHRNKGHSSEDASERQAAAQRLPSAGHRRADPRKRKAGALSRAPALHQSASHAAHSRPWRRRYFSRTIAADDEMTIDEPSKYLRVMHRRYQESDRWRARQVLGALAATLAQAGPSHAS